VLSGSFLSGTDSAIIYDSLIQVHKEKNYKKIEGKMMSIWNFSEAIASFLSGFISLISLRTPFYIDTIVMFFMIPIAFTLIEPKREKEKDKDKNKENPLKEIIKIVKYSIHNNKEIKWLIFYSALIWTSTLTMVWLIQPYCKFVGLPLVYFWIVWGILNLSVGVFSLYAHKIESFFWRKTTLISLIFIAFIWYLLLSIFKSIWAISFIVLFYFVRGINWPILKDYINRIITSDMRATVLSVQNLFWRLVFAIIGPFIGWITDVYSLQLALLTSWSIFLILGLFSLIFLHKNKAL